MSWLNKYPREFSDDEMDGGWGMIDDGWWMMDDDHNMRSLMNKNTEKDGGEW